MITLFGILDWIVLGWFFWPLEITLLLLVHNLAKGSASKYDTFSGGALFWFLLLGGAIMYRVHRWPTWAEVGLYAVAYIAVGFFVSLIKYNGVLRAFRKNASLELAKGEISAFDLANRLDLPNYSVMTEQKSGFYYLNWQKFPIANWWTFWPFFALSSVFDFIEDIIEWLVDQFKAMYQQLSLGYKVSIPKKSE